MCELAIRQLLTTAYSEAYGAGWLERVVNDPEKIARWRERRAEDEKKRQRKGEVAHFHTDLDYSEFQELLDIMSRDWAPLAPALGRKKSFLPLLERFAQLRNTVAHSRNLLPHERELVSGISGEVRNRVTIYMSTKDAGGEYYPRVERVNDNFGNYGEQSADSNPTGVFTSIELRPGDILTFQCRGSDPHGRELQWECEIVTPPGLDDSRNGEDVELSVVIGEEHVGERVAVAIKMRALNARFNRNPMAKVDGYLFFYYRVLPPAGAFP